MDTFHSEDEQLKALKKWWDENGISTIVTIAVALAVIFGWRMWQEQAASKIDNGSFAYQKLVKAVATAQTEPDDIKIATASHLAETLKEEHAGSAYSYFASFFKVKQAVADKDYEAAEKELQWVLQQKPGSPVKDVATLRLARVLFAADREDEALAMLKIDNESSYAPLYAELKGDIMLSRGDYQAAYEAYSLSQDNAKQLELPEPAVLSSKLQYTKSFL